MCAGAGVFQLQQQGVISPGKQNYLIVTWLGERPDWLCYAAQHWVSGSRYSWKFVLLIESLLMANTGWHFTWFSYVLWVIGTTQPQPQGKEAPAVTVNREAITAQFPLTGPGATGTALANVWSSPPWSSLILGFREVSEEGRLIHWGNKHSGLFPVGSRTLASLTVWHCL